MKFSVIFFIIAFIGFIFLGIMHEQVHKAIYTHYDIDSEIDYFNFPNFSTIPESDCPNDFCILAHSINEAITYPAMIFYVLIMMGFLILICIAEDE